MNKHIYLSVLLILVISMFFFACGKKQESSAEPENAQTVEGTIAEQSEVTAEESTMDPQVVEDWDAESTTETESQETKTGETKPKETEPEETEPQATQPIIDPMVQEFAAYLKKTPAEQQAFYETFASPDAFFAWYNSAKAAYDANQDYIDISGGNINLGDLE